MSELEQENPFAENEQASATQAAGKGKAAATKPQEEVKAQLEAALDDG